MTTVSEYAVENGLSELEVAAFLGREDRGELSVEEVELLIGGGVCGLVDRVRALVDDQLRVEVRDGRTWVSVMDEGGVFLVVSSGASGESFRVEEHHLLDDVVEMRDLEAVVRSAKVAESDVDDGYALLCHASDFAADGWLVIVRRLCSSVGVRVMPGAWCVENVRTGFKSFVVDGGGEFVVVDLKVCESVSRVVAQDVAGAVLAAVL